MKRRSSSWALAAIAGLALLAPAAAHDFWIEPSSFRPAPGEAVSLRFLIGEPGSIEHWTANWRKIVSLQDFGPTRMIDHLADIRSLDGAKVEMERIDAQITMTVSGTHMLAFASNQAQSDLDAAAFNAYAVHEGLALPLTLRKAAGANDRRGRELYSRRAKALIQIGRSPTDTVSAPIGQTLELVPEKNPYLLRRTEPLVLRVLLHGKPLAGASVTLERLGAEATHGMPVLSDAAGRVTFPLERRGAWKANVVWSYPIDDPRAEYETIFCSLTFGY